MALIGWRVEWKSSFRDYEGVVIEHSKDQVVVWEFRDLMTYEWNLSQKDYKRWNPALKEFANYHRGLLMKSNIKQSEVCRKVIGIIDALDNSPAMILAKKLALQIENSKLQAAIMDESEEEERQLVEKKKSQSSDNDKLLRKTVEFTLPENIKKQLWEEKHESDESEEEEDDEDDDEDEEDEDDDESDETSDQDPDSDEEESKQPSPHGKKHKSRPKSASKCSPEKKDQVDLKVMILHTKQLRGFSLTLNEEGFQTMLIKLQQDYGKDINVFYRDEDGDVLNILSIDDLLYAYRSEEKLTKTTASISGSIKLKLFAEIVVVANDLIPPKTAESRFSATAGATAPFPANPRRSFDNGNHLADSPDRLQFQPQATTASITEDRYMKSTTSNIFDIVWKKGEVLGVGSFGKVFSGINISNGTKMAIKEVYVHRSKNSKQQVKALQREVEILSQLDHPNIIHYLGTEFSDDRNTLRIFLELANEGSLKDSLREFGAFPEPLLRCYASDIVHGLLYLHQCKIIHRDIKPANLLLSNGVVKLADFGCSSPILSGGQTGIETEHSTIAGTTIYMAPEVMQAGSHLDENNNIDLEDNDGENNNNQEKKAIKYGRKADIWSFGMTLCELANGESPYKNGAAAIYAVCISKQLPRFPAIFSAEAHDFLSRCLLYDVKQRADANELQQHIFMSPRSLEEVRAQTAASLSTTSHQNPMASSVQLAPDSEQFQFSTAMSSSGKLGGPSDPFFVSSDSTKLRQTNTKRRSMRDESKYADDDHDDRISFHGNGVDDSSQFFTCFQQDRPVSMKYKSEDNGEARQTPRLTPRLMNHYASAPTLSTPRQQLHTDNDDDEGKEGGDESRTATIVKDYLVLSANYSRVQENEGSRLNSSRRMTPRQESKKMMDEEEEEVYEDDYEV